MFGDRGHNAGEVVAQEDRFVHESHLIIWLDGIGSIGNPALARIEGHERGVVGRARHNPGERGTDHRGNDKRAHRPIIAAEGLVHSYIHAGNRVGVMLEVNCQTDFVARNEEFKQFVEEVAMHIASEKPEFVRADEISETAVAKQKDIFLGQLEEEARQTGK
ncbi:MAG: hypothetical protein ACO38K_03415, partial [Ilumatobacteraceae bacterium]